MIKDRKILITGGGGFIGSSLAERLADNNEVVLLDTDFDGNTFAFSGLKDNKNVSLIKADILDPEAVSKAARDKHIIIHTAAMVGVQEVLNNALDTLEVNYGGTSNVLKAAAENQKCERLVTFSTSEIFGSGAFRIAENGDTVLSSVQDIRWCYCISKLAAEHLTLSYYRQKGVPAVVVRPFNIFGPKRTGDHVVLRFMLRAIRNQDLEVFGDGTQIRAWCYIDDFCTALLRCLEVKEAIGEAFNIGNPRNTLTIYELAKKIISICGSKSKIIFKAIDFTDIDVRVPDASKMANILKFTPEVDIEDGLARTLEWVKDNIESLEKMANTRKRKYMV